MADYIKRQTVLDAIPLKENMMKKFVSLYATTRDFIALVNEIPAADVLEVVRCKDCIFKGFPNEYDVYFCERTGEEIQLSDFCSHAEREEKNNG